MSFSLLLVFQIPVIHASFKVKVYGCIGDSPALKLMCNMIGHNGYYPWHYCDIKGIYVQKARKRKYSYTPSIKYRSVNSFYSLSRAAQRKRQNIFGHLGISILENVLDVPLPHGILIDYAHVSLLRHFRDIVRVVWLSLSPMVRDKIDDSLKKQPFPNFFHRKMRGVQEFSFIKATELRNLLLYGFIPHFMPYLTIKQLSFVALFTTGVRLIHSDEVFKDTTTDRAKHLLCRYYADHEQYFLHHANFVLHLHQHFHLLYDYHGPLSSINTFHYEDFIGYVSRNRNGTTSFESILPYYYNIDVFLKNLNEHSMEMNNGKTNAFIS